jgi:RimJ/RimL family protein N-acetyltransferase
MAFDRQPTLQGPTLGLRPLQPSDRDALLAVASDPLIWEQHPESDRHTPDKLERFFADALASGGALVVTTADGTIIGSARLEVPDEARSRVLIDHTFLARTHWTPEDYTEVKGLLFDHALRSYETVELRVGVGNARTRGAVEDLLGATHVGTVASPLGDDAVYEVSRDAWANRFGRGDGRA